MAHLEGARFQQADLVLLGELAEARDPLGEVHHIAHSWGKAQGEVLPDLLAGPPGVHVWRVVHGRHLNHHTIFSSMSELHEQGEVRAPCSRMPTGRMSTFGFAPTTLWLGVKQPLIQPRLSASPYEDLTLVLKKLWLVYQTLTE